MKSALLRDLAEHVMRAAHRPAWRGPRIPAIILVRSSPRFAGKSGASEPDSLWLYVQSECEGVGSEDRMCRRGCAASWTGVHRLRWESAGGYLAELARGAVGFAGKWRRPELQPLGGMIETQGGSRRALSICGSRVESASLLPSTSASDRSLA